MKHGVDNIGLVRPGTTTPLAWGLTIAILAMYFGYVLMIVFAPDVMAQPVVGLVNFALLFGILLILFCIVVAFIYTARRNREDIAP